MQDAGVHNVVDILIQNAPKKIRKACNANKGQTQHANHNLKQLGGEDFLSVEIRTRAYLEVSRCHS